MKTHSPMKHIKLAVIALCAAFALPAGAAPKLKLGTLVPVGTS